MKEILTRDIFAQLIPGNPAIDKWYDALCEILPKYGINTPRRIAHFISQCAHESNNFRTLEENLNYSAEALIRVFPRYFGPGKQNANQYARQPEKIANYVYMDKFRTPQGRMGNVQPGDGWMFRGRGLKQLTGRNNYTAFGRTIGMTAEQAAEYVATEKGAVESACWFWATNNLNNIADTDDVVAMTRRINGGNIGLADRQSRYTKAIALLNSPKLSKFPENTVLKRGSTGDAVRMIQQKLGITITGIFGPETEASVRKWQTENKLTSDGIFGPISAKKMFG